MESQPPSLTDKPDKEPCIEREAGQILIVDDNLFFLLKMEKTLQKAGFLTHRAATGRDGLTLAASVLPHLILLDVTLPDISGYDVCEQLKKTPETKDIPVLFISAHDTSDHLAQGLEKGAMDYITKPIEDRIVVSKARVFVQLCQEHRALIQTQTMLIQKENQKKQLEMELLQAQKLEAVGQLAAGIAHEINTPIQFVSDNIRFLKEATDDLLTLYAEHRKFIEAFKAGTADLQMARAVDEAAEKMDIEYLSEEMLPALDQSLDGVGRVASIVRAMKNFAHPGTTEKSPSDLNEAIRTTVTVARNKWKYDAELTMELDESLPLVPCLPGEINQILLNLIVNAADAIHDRRGADGPLGQITIATEQKGDWAEIRIADTGGGIPESIQDRVFDPFFTTKEVGRGSGQGLAIARDVVINKHNGKFFFETRPDEGTVFFVRLPLKPANLKDSE